MKRSKHSSFADKALTLAAERFGAMPPERQRAMAPALENYFKITGLSKHADTTALQAAMRRAMAGNDPSKNPEAPMMPVMWLMPSYTESHRYMPPVRMPAEPTQPEATQPEAPEEQEAPDTTAQSEAPQPEKAEKREARVSRITFGRNHEGRISRVLLDSDGARIAAFALKRGSDGRISELVRED